MFKKINIITYCIMILSFILLSFNVLKLDILPTKYLIIFFVLIGLLAMIFGLFTFVGKNRVVKVVFIILTLLIAVFSYFVSVNIVFKTDEFFSNIEEVKETSVYYVVALKERGYKSISDLNNKSIGISNISVNDKAIEVLNSKFKYKASKYDNIVTLSNDLLEGKVDAIYVNSNIKHLLDEEIDDFSSKTVVVEQFEISIDSNDEKQNETDSDLKDEEVVENSNVVSSSGDAINIYISGIDTWGSISNVSRSDVNIIMTINQKEHKILLTTIPRDMYVQLHGTSGPKDKLTHAGIYGINMSIATIEDFLNIDIDYYVRVNFNTLINVIDTIGGVNVYSDVAFKAGGYSFVAGNNYLDGKKALAFSRARKQFSGGDRVRGQHQQSVITAIVQKVTSSKVLLGNYSNILGSLNNSFQSNVPDTVIRSFFKEQLDSMNSWDIRSISVDGSGSYTRSTYSMPGWNLYVMIPNQNTVTNAHNEIVAME